MSPCDICLDEKCEGILNWIFQNYMQMNKYFTTYEQSQRLLKFGVLADTADAYYVFGDKIFKKFSDINNIIEIKREDEE